MAKKDIPALVFVIVFLSLITWLSVQVGGMDPDGLFYRR